MSKGAFILMLVLTVFKFSITIGQKCPKLPSGKVTASLVLNDNGKIYDADSVLRICQNSEVNVYSNSSLLNVKYWFNYEGDSIPKQNGINLPSGKFKFDKEGTFLLIQQGELGTNKTYSCKVVEVLSRSLPAVSATTCAPKDVIIEIPATPDLKYDSYDIAWGDAQSSTVNKNTLTVSHTYTSVQTYYINFIGKRNNIFCSTGNVFGFKPDGISPYLAPSTINKLELNNDAQGLKMTSTTFNTLQTDILQRESGGVFAVNGQLVNYGTMKENNVVALDSTKQYCFKLQTADACGNKVFSGELCTINLKAKAENSQNVLNWTAYPTAITNYEVKLNSIVLTNIYNKSQNTYTHLNTFCGQKYCYQVTTFIGLTESVSQLRCVDGKNSVSLPAITEGLVSINNKDINLSWSIPTGFISKEVTIDKADKLGGVFTEIKKTNLNLYKDSFDETKNSPPCYQLSYSDNCGNVSPISDSYCPVLLSLKDTELSWTPYEKFTSSTYTMEVSDRVGGILKNFNVNGTLKFTPNPDDFTVQDLRFRIKTSSSGKVSFSNYKPLSFALKVLVPNVFTPNGDGFNDTFKIFTAFVRDYQYQIFDRWGNVIFTNQNSTDEWDGRINGQAPQAGTYIYTLSYTSQGGQEFKKEGVISIVL